MLAAVTDGFLYAATGEKWVREAMASAAQLRRVNPDIPSILFTNLPEIVAGGPFDEVRVVPDQPWVKTEVKLWAVNRSPFDRTVFMDTDTYACDDVSDLFTVLDRFDFAAVPVPLRLSKRSNHADPADIPDAFQSMNGGLFSWRWNEHTRALFQSWWDLYQADKPSAGDSLMDQPSLRVALWRSQCQILFLPPEFNMRTIRYKAQPTTAVGPIRIIHGRPKDFPALERRWNARTEPRLLTPNLQYQARLALRLLVRGRARARLKDATTHLRQRLAGD
jgi:hypothetical protein